MNQILKADGYLSVNNDSTITFTGINGDSATIEILGERFVVKNDSGNFVWDIYGSNETLVNIGDKFSGSIGSRSLEVELTGFGSFIFSIMIGDVVNNQIRFPVNEIDFRNDVGITDQSHDLYPDDGQFTRYDWMRIIILGLLSNQSGFNQPINFRPGSLWYDMYEFMSHNGNDFESIINHVKVGDNSLSHFANLTNNAMNINKPSVIFSGLANIDTNLIRIPPKIHHIISDGVHPFLYKNGKLIDPNLTSFVYIPVSVKCTGDAVLSENDKFTVIIKGI